MRRENHVYVGKCTVGQDMKPASQPVTFLLSFFFLTGKKIMIRRNILKTEKRYPARIRILFFLS